MAAYMGLRIVEGAYTYEYVIGKRPDLQDGIDTYLIDKGREDLITHE